MIDTLNLLQIKRFESTACSETSWEFINHWLRTERNYNRLQQECEKIWSHCVDDPCYDAERAFKVLGQRFLEVCELEMKASANSNGTTIHNQKQTTHDNLQ